jgi:hypothetical protein
MKNVNDHYITENPLPDIPPSGNANIIFREKESYECIDPEFMEQQRRFNAKAAAARAQKLVEDNLEKKIYKKIIKKLLKKI